MITLAACGLSEVQGPPGAAQIVVQGLLSAEASEHVLWIEQSTVAGAPISGGLRPLEMPPQRVEVRDSAGTVFSFQPDPTNPARFVVSFTPAYGARYDLLVEAGSWVVRGSASIPPRLTIVAPATDTVRIPRNSQLQVSWASQTSPWVAVFTSQPDGQPSSFFGLLVRGDTSHIFPGFSIDTAVVTLVALDSVTARVMDPFSGGFGDEFEGNLTGGVGFFGATARDRLVVIQQ